MKILTPLCVVALAASATLAQASNRVADMATADAAAHVTGPRDPYTDGAKAGKFDVYSEGAKITDKRDPYTDGAHS
ncbi:hypothetical protein [Ralstonia solanacearum]|uniref:hypothetical protein n=1 Tax=Ralstonia solanacearum TaxID=305 RepID=UPI00078EA65F|nr:hypothetical protein [Ralstonia solanacearum]AMP37681.1 hypothetical protein LBM2029_09095 [Ralstonia solanacearum]AXV86505.1 hypothetical protein CJO78_09415 [Ralstonia solanacearum]AXW23751.1 hypothetical protein CJO86_09195 [Ralstonia solanacearum]AXW80683.1 hypothetical protein CJO98_09425 [Ralstonia solanacearum]